MRLMNITRLKTFLPLALLAGLASGCATPSLWDRTSAFEWKPIPPDKVLLPADTNQPCAPTVLFRQTATVHLTFMCRNVGWRVGQSPDEVADTREAIHQLTNTAAGFQSVPVYFPDRVPANASSRPPGYAVINNTNNQLTFHVDGVQAGPYTLPASQHPQNTEERVLLTPLAVVLDVPMCVFGLAVYVCLHL